MDIGLFKNYLKALEVLAAKNKAMIRQYEAARLDLSIPSKDTLGKVRRTYTFPSSAEKMQFVEELRRAKLRSCEFMAHTYCVYGACTHICYLTVL